MLMFSGEGARDPEYKVLVVSASKQRSDDFSSFTKRDLSGSTHASTPTG